MKCPKGGPRPINARSEIIAPNGMSKYACRYGRAVTSIDAYFEWQAIRGKPFALAAIKRVKATLPTI